jgi:hypothetical protein
MRRRRRVGRNSRKTMRKLKLPNASSIVEIIWASAITKHQPRDTRTPSFQRAGAFDRAESGETR